MTQGIKGILMLLVTGFIINTYACNPDQDDSPQTLTEEYQNPDTTDLDEQEVNSINEDSMKIRIQFGGNVVTATVLNNPTSKDFLSMLPLTITLEDYAGTEKICYLSRKLNTDGAPAGVDPDVGDITYYAPWGNLAIFYKDFGYANGLIKLGEIEGNTEALKVAGNIEATIELIK